MCPTTTPCSVNGMDDLPLSFGKSASKPKAAQAQATKARIDQSKRQHVPAAAAASSASEQAPIASSSKSIESSDLPPNAQIQEQKEEEEADEELETLDLPASHEVVLKDHTKVTLSFMPLAWLSELRPVQQTVSAVSVDPAGARLITGGYDYECKLWDFGGMDASFKPFRSWEPVPEGSYQVNDTQFSPSGDRILVASATPQVKLFSRDGELLSVFSNEHSLRYRNLTRVPSERLATVATCISEISKRQSEPFRLQHDFFTHSPCYLAVGTLQKLPAAPGILLNTTSSSLPLTIRPCAYGTPTA